MILMTQKSLAALILVEPRTLQDWSRKWPDAPGPRPYKFSRNHTRYSVEEVATWSGIPLDVVQRAA